MKKKNNYEKDYNNRFNIIINIIDNNYVLNKGNFSDNNIYKKKKILTF